MKEVKTITAAETAAEASAVYAQYSKDLKVGTQTWKIPLDDIYIEDDWNDRSNFDDIPELADGIMATKGTEPIYVRAQKNKRYIVVAGERRYRSYVELKRRVEAGELVHEEWMDHMAAFVVSSYMSRTELMGLKLTENNSKPFEPVEEAMAYKKLLDSGCSQADIARMMGKNRMHVSNRIALSNISGVEKELVAEKFISATEWVKLYKLVPELVKRVNYLIDKKKDCDSIEDVEDDIRDTYSQDGLDKLQAAANEGDKPPVPETEPDAEESDPEEGEPDERDPKAEPFQPEQQWDREKTQKMMDELDKDRTDNAGGGLSELMGKPKTGLSALLDKSTEAPYIEPPLEPAKKKGFTAKDFVSDDVGSTLGDQTPETGTVEQTLKDIALSLRMIERHCKGDSKISDHTFIIEKKLRYLQKISRETMMGKLTGASAPGPDEN